jgi:hypothetical protein
MERSKALGLMMAIVLVGGAARADAPLRPVAARSQDRAVKARPAAAHAQTQYDEKHGIAYAVSPTADGGIQMTAQAADLQFDKTTYRDGHFQLRISVGDDAVTFAATRAGVDVTRGRRTATLKANASADEVDHVRGLMAGSHAVKKFRQLAAILELAEEDSAPMRATLVATALVGALDGDPGAPSRIARRLARKAAVSQRKASMYEDCWETYDWQLNRAWDDYGVCMSPATWVSYDFYNYTCSLLWMIRVEGAWFQYLGCSAIPGLQK